MRESDIIHESGNFWVGKIKGTYTVYRAGVTHSVADSSYQGDEDGKSIAVARCEHLGRAEKP